MLKYILLIVILQGYVNPAIAEHIDQATIIFYRPHIIHRSRTIFSIMIGDKLVGALKKGTHFSINIDPGTYTIHSNYTYSNSRRSVYTLESGKIYYMKVYWRKWDESVNILNVPASEGRKDLVDITRHNNIQKMSLRVYGTF
jgi:hypothetical protein